MFHSLTGWLLGLSPVWLLAACGALVFLEDAIFIGFVLPGETAAVIVGVASGLGHVPLWIALVVVIAASIVGDTVGYEVGRHLFARVRSRGILAKHSQEISRAEELLRRRGPIAVFLGRFTAFFRAMMPALAGASRMRYPVFLRWNALGGVVWGATYVVIGNVAGKSYETVAHKATTGFAIALAVVVVLALVVWRLRARRR